MNCHFCSKIKCRMPSGILGGCEYCDIPNSFGYFFFARGTKRISEQRFILEKARAGRIDSIDKQIAELLFQRCEVESIISRDEYHAKTNV